MNRRKAVAAMALAPLASAQPVRQQLLGVWKVVSYEWKDKATAQVQYPMGKRPVGRITYDAAGRMSAQLMSSDRKSVGGPATLGAVSAIRSASAEDLREMVSGYISYFGRFEIDEKSRTVIHHVEGALIPSWVGSAQRRSYELKGDTLILSGAFDQAIARITWHRDTA